MNHFKHTSFLNDDPYSLRNTLGTSLYTDTPLAENEEVVFENQFLIQKERAKILLDSINNNMFIDEIRYIDYQNPILKKERIDVRHVRFKKNNLEIIDHHGNTYKISASNKNFMSPIETIVSFTKKSIEDYNHKIFLRGLVLNIF